MAPKATLKRIASLQSVQRGESLTVRSQIKQERSTDTFLFVNRHFSD